MLCDKNESLESRNFVDGVDFTRNDPCIFVTYPPGASGDLLMSIIDKHYLRTGCEYYGISNTGQVRFLSSDYETIDLQLVQHNRKFDNDWFYSLADKLSERNLNYSLLDQMIFGCHMFEDQQIQDIVDYFPKAKVINIRPANYYGGQLIMFLGKYKNFGGKQSVESFEHEIPVAPFEHDRVLNVPFGALFNEPSYQQCYQNIIDFLNLKGRVVHWDYVNYYLDQQAPEIAQRLIAYSKTLGDT